MTEAQALLDRLELASLALRDAASSGELEGIEGLLAFRQGLITELSVTSMGPDESEQIGRILDADELSLSHLEDAMTLLCRSVRAGRKASAFQASEPQSTLDQAS